MPLRIRRHLAAGLLVVVPLVVTAAVVHFLFDLLDSLARPLARRLVGREVWGVGAALTLLVVYLAGLLSTNLAGKKLLAVFERLLENLPVVKTVYTASKQLVEAVSPGGRQAFRRVVLVEYPKKGTWALAFVTGEGIGPLRGEAVTVYVPTAINPTSGFVLFAPEDELLDPELSVEEGLKLVVSGGVVVPPVAGDARTDGPAA